MKRQHLKARKHKVCGLSTIFEREIPLTEQKKKGRKEQVKVARCSLWSIRLYDIILMFPAVVNRWIER